MKRVKKICDVKEDIIIFIVILGDIGKVVFEGFVKVEGFKVVVYYFKNGVSVI